MNVFQKLTEARHLLESCEISKSGHNTYSNYDYYELSDYMPHIKKINKEVGLCSVVTFDYENQLAYLTLTNVEKSEEQLIFSMRLKDITLKACNDMQNEGAKQTFARRYLYICSYEISESDPSETGPQSENKDKLADRLAKEIKDTIESLEKNCVLAGHSVLDVIKRYNADEKKSVAKLEEIPVKMLAGYDQMMIIAIKKKKLEAQNK